MKITLEEEDGDIFRSEPQMTLRAMPGPAPAPIQHLLIWMQAPPRMSGS